MEVAVLKFSTGSSAGEVAPRVDPMSAPVDPSNVGTAREWDGPLGEFWADHADRKDAQVARYLPALLDAAAIAPGAHVLDVGCGTGRTSRQAARLAGSGSVTGIDLSARMLDLARRRAADEGMTNVRFEQADAQVADLGTDRYDRIISRNGVMFFGDPVAAFTNLARALRPDGRLVVLVWQAMAENEWINAFLAAVAAGGEVDLPPADAPGPFSLGDPDRLRLVLTAAGFAEPQVRDVREPVCYGADVDSALPIVLDVVGRRIAGFDEAGRAAAKAALRADLAAHLGPDGVTYRSAVWIAGAGRAP
jgi:SAM-dependent methyltransferase